MKSKNMNIILIMFAAAIIKVQSLVIGAETYAYSMSCQKCIRNNFVFCTNQSWYSLESDNSPGYYNPVTACHSTKAGALSNSIISTSGALKSGFRCSYDFTSPDMALAACPTKVSVCGAIKYYSANAS